MNAESSLCESMSEAISLRAAGCLNDDEAAKLQKHLAECESCRKVELQLRSLCQDLSLPHTDDEAEEMGFVTRALDEIESHNLARVGRSRPRASWGQLSAAITLGLLIAVAGRLFPQPAMVGLTVARPTAIPTSPTVEIPEGNVPTLITLGRAVESEADLDRLLAQAYPPLQSTHLDLPLID